MHTSESRRTFAASISETTSGLALQLHKGGPENDITMTDTAAMMENQIDTVNKQQQLAYELIANTNSSFFLTGRAGTGKTTFLHNVQQMVDKQFITLAPTGVAAILAEERC